ncbi:hypothetical protein [Streptomyces sp. NPDC050504]|uniref:SCO6745 family protein n=1 Tax=Streptomyces sp. NPDC050504 TaxID=3365618 RepID=UPI00378C2F81
MWHLLEPLHALLYYAPEANAEAAALGYATDERWPSYFAWRSAPLGPVSPELVTAVFHSFSPRMVAAYVPAIRDVALPSEVLAARLRAVDRTYRALFGDALASPALAEAAELARTAAGSADLAGRPIAAANAALLAGTRSAPSGAPGAGPALPEAPHLVLWKAATVLREHRGDGHVAALLAAGLDPVETLVSFASVGAAPVEVFASRGWSAEEWAAARARLERRGLVDAEGRATEAGRALRADVELRTDRLAAGPWAALGEAGTARLAELLGEYWVGAIGSGLLPGENTLGIGKV